MKNIMNSSKLKDRYMSWLKSKTEFSDVSNNVVRIDVPFVDNLSDNIVMYALKQQDGSIILTDDGWTMDNLESLGISINRSSKRKNILHNELNSFGVSIEDDELFIKSNIDNFPENKHRLLQAILFANDMFMLSSNNTNSIFIEDMSSFLHEHGIRFMKDVSFIGESGLTHKFDFSIAGDEKIHDKLIKTMASPNNSMYAKSIVTDIEQVQLSPKNKRPSDFYVFLQDEDKNVNKKVDINDDIIKLFQINKITPVPFSEKNKFVDKLAE